MRPWAWLWAAVLVVGSCADGTDEATTPSVSDPTTSLVSVSTTSEPASTTTSASTSQPTVTTTSLTDVGDLESGLFCRDLAALGYGYSSAVAYWTREGSPDRMDADRNGIPCETVYSGDIVAEFWGDSPPTTATDTSSVESIGDVPAGMYCRDLISMDFGFPEAVAYWMREGMAARMDADGNEVPCETVYPVGEVERIYGTSSALAVYLVTTVGEPPIPRFEATGPAVDAGLICPSGTADQVGGGENRWEDLYVCDDGSGTFIAGADIHIDGDRLYETWSIVSGTGLYKNLSGGGGADTGLTSDGLWQDRMYGRLETTVSN